MPSNQPLLANQLSCVRGDRCLFQELSFSVQPGQCLHVIGANGSGKTSLLRILCGLSQADHGKVSWGGVTIENNQDYLDSCAYIGHKDGLKNELTTIENLRHYQTLDQKHDEHALDVCLHKMNLLESADLLTQQLSFGQRRRLAFARLLIRNFQLWVLDEPFTGIDVDGRALIETLCVKHLQNHGAIVITHHQSLADSPLNSYRNELKLD